MSNKQQACGAAAKDKSGNPGLLLVSALAPLAAFSCSQQTASGRLVLALFDFLDFGVHDIVIGGGLWLSLGLLGTGCIAISALR